MRKWWFYPKDLITIEFCLYLFFRQIFRSSRSAPATRRWKRTFQIVIWIWKVERDLTRKCPVRINLVLLFSDDEFMKDFMKFKEEFDANVRLNLYIIPRRMIFLVEVQQSLQILQINIHNYLLQLLTKRDKTFQRLRN